MVRRALRRCDEEGSTDCAIVFPYTPEEDLGPAEGEVEIFSIY